MHWLHENEGVRFALCGSTTRKVRKGQANLLGGRGQTFDDLCAHNSYREVFAQFAHWRLSSGKEVDFIEVFHYTTFLQRLWGGALF